VIFMHELVIVSGIIDAVTQVAQRENKKVSMVRIAVGELASFDINLIRDLIEMLRKGTCLEEAEVIVEEEGAKVRCKACGASWGFKELVEPLTEDEREMIHFLPELVSSFSKCPSCGSRDLEIESGRGIRVSQIELE